jgi:tRNA (guanosine-2'-O-)-methyltransferase
VRGGDAALKQLRPTDVKRLHRDWGRRSAGRLALLLEAVQSPYNVGAIVRTAAAYRVEHLYLCGQTTSPASPKSAKVSLGTERYLSWTAFERGADAADSARDDGYSVVGLELADAAVPLHQLAAGRDVCLAVGNEDHGLSPSTLAACDAVAFLPLAGRVGSLNVATATAIALYELRRQGWTV